MKKILVLLLLSPLAIFAAKQQNSISASKIKVPAGANVEGLTVIQNDTTNNPNAVFIGNAGSGANLLMSTGTAGGVGFKAPTGVSSSLVFTLPSADGSSSDCLKTDGSKNLSFGSCGGGTGSTGRFSFFTSSATATTSGVSTSTLLEMTNTDFTNNPKVMVINSSGTGNALSIVSNGVPSGGLQNGTGGALNIRMNSISEGLVVFSSVTDTQQGSAFVLLKNESGTYNDPILWIEDIGGASNPAIRIDSYAPDLEIVNESTDVAHGLGKWEPFAVPYQGRVLQINNRAWDNSTFETLAYWEPLSRWDLMPGLYLRAQTLANDSAVLSSSDTTGIHFFGTNGSTVGMTGPLGPSGSYTFGLPDTVGASGDILYNSGNRGNNFNVRQWRWTGANFRFSTTTGVSVSTITASVAMEPPSLPRITLVSMSYAGIGAGSLFYCSDCTTDGVVVSTGTGAGAVARINERTTAIQ